MEFDPNCMAIAIGSLPHEDVGYAIELIRRYLPEAPIWPQLPKLGLNESMMIQYTQGMPCVKIDRERCKAYFDTSSDGYLDEVSARLGMALDGNYGEFGITKDYARGFYAFKDSYTADFPEGVKLLKGHVTGPISLGLSLHDENGRSILYNEEFKDVVIRSLAMKAKWQVSELSKIGNNAPVMIFFDEPYLTQIGTPFISIQRDEAIEMLDTCLDEVDGVKGIHVCGNTDWSLVTSTHTDIINFDAYAFPQSLSLYPDDIKAFFDRGGMIAWGITPSSVEIAHEDAKSILGKLENAVDLLCDTGFDKKRVLSRSFISPSCGTGSLSIEHAQRVFKINYEVSCAIKKKYF